MDFLQGGDDRFFTFCVLFVRLGKDLFIFADMENELPKIDIPQDFIAGKLTTSEVLKLYTNYPCRLKAMVIAYCSRGAVEASINLVRYDVRAGDVITILPNSILQIHTISDEVEVYFLGYSSEFVEYATWPKPIMGVFYALRENAAIRLVDDDRPLVRNYLELTLESFVRGHFDDRESIKYQLFFILSAIGRRGLQHRPPREAQTTAERISKAFGELVLRHYAHERSVSFYAEKLGITPAHLSTTVRQATGKTCGEVISSMIIMEAKTRLRETDLSIQEIAYSLNFPSLSFFGKYFKRHVGVGPLEYRNGK